MVELLDVVEFISVSSSGRICICSFGFMVVWIVSILVLIRFVCFGVVFGWFDGVEVLTRREDCQEMGKGGILTR